MIEEKGEKIVKVYKALGAAVVMDQTPRLSLFVLVSRKQRRSLTNVRLVRVIGLVIVSSGRRGAACLVSLALSGASSGLFTYHFLPHSRPLSVSFKSARPSANLVRIISAAIMAPKKKKNAPRKHAGRARVDTKATKVNNLVPS